MKKLPTRQECFAISSRQRFRNWFFAVVGSTAFLVPELSQAGYLITQSGGEEKCIEQGGEVQSFIFGSNCMHPVKETECNEIAPEGYYGAWSFAKNQCHFGLKEEEEYYDDEGDDW